MPQLDVHAQLLPVIDAALGDLLAAVGRVVQHLDLQAVAGVVDRAGRVDDALDHAAFVEDRQLNGHAGQLLEPVGRPGDLPSVAGKQVDQPVAVEAVGADEHEQPQVGSGERPAQGG